MGGETDECVLHSAELKATFLPGCGMLGTSLRHRGEDLLARPRSIDDYRTGGSTAMPLLHPWANRLQSSRYTGVPTDRNGLPIHGTMHGRPFALAAADARHLSARFDFGAHAELLRTFPFPHELTIDVSVDETQLSVTTAVANTGTAAMPISFGWHPFFTLPGTPRAAWELRLPACRRHVLDSFLIPTGEVMEHDESRALIGNRTYDDHFSLGDDRRFEIRSPQRQVVIEFDEHYPHAQIYLPGPTAPLTGNFICIEPMTANTNALIAGTTPMLQVGVSFAATFRVTVL